VSDDHQPDPTGASPDDGLNPDVQDVFEHEAERAASESRTKHPRQLDREPNRYNLIHSVAAGERVADLARRYEVTTSAICQFKTRHAAEIEQARANIEDKLVGLWAAKKEARVAVYQQQIADVLEMGDTATPESVRVAQSALKSIAEELGHLSARVAIQGDLAVKVNYAVNGVDQSDLT
jgi:hypothetical protein